MAELLGLYLWTLVAALLAAPLLALLGCQLANRDRPLQILCLGQAAMLGVLLGIGLLNGYQDAPWFYFGPLVFAFAASGGVYRLTDALAERRAPSKGTSFALVFALLMAICHLTSALLPGLESHMAQVHFGDLATLSGIESRILAAGALLGLFYILVRLRSISRHSFEWAVFGVAPREIGFRILTLGVLALGIQFLGFLFTMAALFVPTGLLSFTRHPGVRLHYFLCAAVAWSGTAVGFLLSLRYPHFPTVPTIVAAMFGIGGVVLAVDLGLFQLRRWTQRVRAGLRSQNLEQALR